MSTFDLWAIFERKIAKIPNWKIHQMGDGRQVD